MRRIGSYLLALPLILWGQNDLYFSPVFDVSEVSGPVESISGNDLEAHLAFLASTVTEGRGTGQRGLQVAAHYIASQFRRMGLVSLNRDGSFFQRYEVVNSRLEQDPVVALLYDDGTAQVKETFEYQEDFFISRRGLTSGLEIQSPAVFAGYGLVLPENGHDDYEGIDVINRVVLIIEGGPESHREDESEERKSVHVPSVREKLEMATKKGAAALLVATSPKSGAIFKERFQRWGRGPRRANMTLPNSQRAVPLFFVSGRMADRILAGLGTTLQELQVELDRQGTPVSTVLDNRRIRITLHVERESLVVQNVAGYLPGNDPNVGHETIIMSAHYDHLGLDEEGTIWPGADDNGTGTSVLLEVAEAVAEEGTRLRRGYLFLALSGEERGLLGSRYYVSHPLMPLDNAVANLNIDMVGRNAPDSIYVIGSNMISEDLHETIEFAATKVDGLHLNYRYNSLDDPNRFYYRSDHYNFAKEHIPTIFYFGGIHEDYHKPTDTADKIDFRKLEKVARLVFLTAWGVTENVARPRKNAGDYPELPGEIRF